MQIFANGLKGNEQGDNILQSTYQLCGSPPLITSLFWQPFIHTTAVSLPLIQHALLPPLHYYFWSYFKVSLSASCMMTSSNFHFYCHSSSQPSFERCFFSVCLMFLQSTFTINRYMWDIALKTLQVVTWKDGKYTCKYELKTKCLDQSTDIIHDTKCISRYREEHYVVIIGSLEQSIFPQSMVYNTGLLTPLLLQTRIFTYKVEFLPSGSEGISLEPFSRGDSGSRVVERGWKKEKKEKYQ